MPEPRHGEEAVYETVDRTGAPAGGATSTSSPPKSIKHILVGFDGSPSSKRAALFALNLARATGADVHLVKATESPVDEIEPATEEEVESRRSTDRDLLAVVRREAEHLGVTVRTDVLEGPPAQVLLQVAGDDPDDLIVVGTRGLRGPAKVLLGSVSQEIIANASVPVTVVR